MMHMESYGYDMELIWILHDSTVYQDKSNHFDGIIYILVAIWLPAIFLKQ